MKVIIESVYWVVCGGVVISLFYFLFKFIAHKMDNKLKKELEKIRNGHEKEILQLRYEDSNKQRAHELQKKKLEINKR